MSGMSAGQIVGGIIGATIGYFSGNPMMGWAIGSAIGGAIDPPEGPHVYGPRLEDLRPQSSEYGRPIPVVYGTVGLAGNVIWQTDIVERSTDETSGGGGKGGAPETTTTTYSYYGNFAVALCEGPISGVYRIWAGPDKRLIYDNSPGNRGTINVLSQPSINSTGSIAIAGDTGSTVIVMEPIFRAVQSVVTQDKPGIRIYLGSEDQMPDPLIESIKGIGNTSAYRGTAYIVFEMLPLDKDGNRLPFIFAEIVKNGDDTCDETLALTNLVPDAFETLKLVDSGDHIWASGVQSFYQIDRETNTTVATYQILSDAIIAAGGYLPYGAGGTLYYSGGYIWVIADYDGTWTSRHLLKVSTATGQVVADTNITSLDHHVYQIKGDATNLYLYGSYSIELGIVSKATNLLLFTVTTGVQGYSTTGSQVELDGMYGRVYVACEDATSGFAGGGLWTIHVNAYTASVEKTIPSFPLRGLLIDGGTLWACGSPPGYTGGFYADDATLYQFDRATLELQNVTITSSGSHMQYAYHMVASTNSVWFGPPDGNSGVTTNYITRVDKADHSVHFVGAPIGGYFGDFYLSSDGLTIYSTFESDTGDNYGATISTATSAVDICPSGANASSDTYQGTGLFDGSYLWFMDDNSTFPDSRVVKWTPPRSEELPTYLSEVVTDLSERAGMTSGQLNVTALTDVVDGYVVARQCTMREAVEVLRPVYFFDQVESGSKVKYVKRGGSLAVTIPDEDLGAYSAGSEPVDPLVTTRKMENELPRALYVTYMCRATEYENATKHQQRQIGASGEVSSRQLSLVLSDTKAQQVCDVGLYSTWNNRISNQFFLPRKYAYLEPTDLVSVKGHTIRLDKLSESPNGLLECSGVNEDISIYSPYTVVTETATRDKVIATVPTTYIALMDISMLRDVDSDPGFYFAATGNTDNWNGTSLMKSVDSGASYTLAQAVTTAAVMGSTTTVLGAFTANTFDVTNSLTVRLLGDGSLSSVSTLAMFSGQNSALVGDEIIQFKYATLNVDGSYTLHHLLRGRRGTEWAASTHVIGERFVLLNFSTLRRITGTTSEIGLDRLWKSPSVGSTLAATPSVTFANQGAGLECYAPCHLGGGRASDGAVKIKWIPRTRVGGEWRDFVDVPMVEASESYELEIWNSSFTTLKRTVTALSSPTYTYSAANQTTDFGSTQATVYTRVYQISALVGRGRVLQGSV